MDAITRRVVVSSALVFFVVALLSTGGFASVAGATDTELLDGSDNLTDTNLTDTNLTETPTPTPTQTATPTPTPTLTLTETPSLTDAPTLTDTPTLTPTETATPTPTPTQTATSTPTPTETAEPVPTAEDSDTGGETSLQTDADSQESSQASDAETTTPTSTAGEPGTSADSAESDSTESGTGEDGTESSSDDETGTSDDAPSGDERDESVEVVDETTRPMPRGPTNGTVVMSFRGVPVTTISFDRNSDGQVTVAELSGVPSDVEEPEGEQLSVVRISVPDDLTDTDAKVTFRVPVEALEDAGVPNDDVWLAHYDAESGEWERLETQLVRQSDGWVVYSASTPGFSLFAVQGDSSEDRGTTATDSREPTETAKAAGLGAGGGSASAAFFGGFGFPIAMLLLMGVASIFTALFGARTLESVRMAGRETE